MPELQIQFYRGGIFLPRLNLWLDPPEPQLGPEQVFISHAHSDHIGAHREVILSAPTAKLMQARLGAERVRQHVLSFGERRQFGRRPAHYAVTLLPAGHIFGSTMALIEAAGESLLYTGDFKLRPGLSAEPCQPHAADVLIMETTYGRPEYQFPPTEAVMRGVIRFCQEALDNDETAVLLGYSLGKSQELLCGLGDAGLPLMLHGTVFKLTQIYEQFGHCFPKYERYEAGTAKGKVLLCPPSIVNSAMLRNLGKTRVAVLTGWAVDPNCRYRYQAHAAFPLSDHADFPDLIRMVELVRPRKVYTLHGFAADFARALRERGFDAQALSEQEQMPLPLGESERASARGVPARVGRSAVLHLPEGERRREGEDEVRLPEHSLINPVPPPSAFVSFAETCAAIAKTSGKLEKVRLLADYLRGLDDESLRCASIWFTGLPFAASENKVLQLGWALLRDALCAVGQVDETAFHQVYLRHSDLGETAYDILLPRPRAVSVLTLGAIDALFHQLHATRGPLAKRPLLIRGLEHCTALEGKFLVKIITSDLRIGLKEGLVEEGIGRAFEVSADEVRQANLLLGNIGRTALLARAHQLATAGVTPFRPVKFMLASPEQTAGGIWERMQERTSARASRRPGSAAEIEEPVQPVWIEDKYDGIRCQLHKVDERVELYSRDLKEMTKTFFDLAGAARRLPANCILDGEILAMRDEQVLPFAELQKRLGRREDDLFLGEEIPIQFVAFDLLWLNGESFLNRPLRERRRALEEIKSWPAAFRLARITQASSAAEIEAAFAAARSRRNEGLMVKDPNSVYSPGRRGLAWLKLKKPLATLDCVVVGAEYGHGKRKAVLSDYTFAVRDDETGELRTIGKAYSGLTDLEIARLTEHFLSRVIRQHGRYHEVEPDTVLEIAFDKIQPSPRHSSGLAMRFPRIVRIRTDKTPADIDTVATARRLARPEGG